MSIEYINGFKDGFKDGFERGYEQAKYDLGKTTRPVEKQPDYPERPIWDQPKPFPWGLTGVSKCNVCGMSWNSITGYVCNNSACPTKVTCGTGNISTASGTDAVKPTARFGSFTGQEYLNDAGC